MSKTPRPDATADAQPAQPSQPSQPANAPSLPPELAEELARLRAERDEAIAFAERANAAARAAHAELAARGETSDRPARGGEPRRLRALCGVAFSLNGERKRLRTGEVIEARPEDLEDDGLALGTHFELAR